MKKERDKKKLSPVLARILEFSWLVLDLERAKREKMHAKKTDTYIGIFR